MPRIHCILMLSNLVVWGCAQSPAAPSDTDAPDTDPITTPTTPLTTPTTTGTTTTTTGTTTEWDGTWSGTLEVQLDDFNGGDDACLADLTLVVDSAAVPQISGRADCELTSELRGVVDLDFEGDLAFLGGTFRLAYDLLDNVSAWDGVFVDEQTFRGRFDGDNYGYSDAYYFLWSGDWELTRQ